MTVKVSETFMLCCTISLEYIKTIRLNLNRYFLIQPPIPSNFIFKILPKVYHTFGHTRTSIYRVHFTWTDPNMTLHFQAAIFSAGTSPGTVLQTKYFTGLDAP